MGSFGVFLCFGVLQRVYDKSLIIKLKNWFLMRQAIVRYYIHMCVELVHAHDYSIFL